MECVSSSLVRSRYGRPHNRPSRGGGHAPATLRQARASRLRGHVNLDVENHYHPVLKAPLTAWRAFKRLTQLSLPRSYPIVQFPNAPLILAFASGLVASNTHGREHSYAQSISYLAMAIWGLPRALSRCQRVPAVARTGVHDFDCRAPRQRTPSLERALQGSHPRGSPVEHPLVLQLR
jgi:hypothetical protein